MKKIMMLLLMCLTVFAGGASAFMVVNVDLSGKPGLYVGQGAFIDPGKDFWNNGTGTNLKASDGVTVTGVTVSVGGGTYSNGTEANLMMKDYHYKTGGNADTITISGLEPNADYLIYVYGGINSKPTTYILNGVVANLSGTAANSGPRTFSEGQDYVKMATRSDSAGVIAGTYRSTPVAEGNICGLQIIFDPRGAAHTPTPANGGNLIDPATLTQLSWLSPDESISDPNIDSVTGYDVYLRVRNPILDVVTKVEAENYTAMSGVNKETCSDTGGGQNLGSTAAGDWAEYRIDVPLKGPYAMNFRVSKQTTGTATINLSLNGSAIGSVTVPRTGGWQNWTTVGTKVAFDTNEPNAILRLDFAGSANVNWFSYQAEPNEVGYLPVSPNQPGKSHPVSLAYETKYDWRVDTHVAWDSTGVTGNLTDIIKGRTWQLTTKSFYMVPVLRFDNVTTAMSLLPAVLTAQVTQNTKPITSVVFEVLDGAPATVTRTDSDPTNTNLTAELTTAAAGTYFVKLTVSDGTTTVQDIAAVRVYATACEAAKHVSGYTQNYYDTNSDCVVTMLDFAELARQWLDNTAMTSPEPFQIAFGYIPVDFLVEAENAYRPEDPNFTAGAPLTTGTEGGDPRINNNGDIFGSSGGAFIWFANEGKFLSYQFEIPAVGGYTLYFKSSTGAANRTLEFEQVDPTTGVFVKDLFVVPVASTEAVQSATVNFPDAGIITVRVTPHTPNGGFINQDFFAFKKL
jgi:hypothetical protein